jgi:hypothetical protein
MNWRRSPKELIMKESRDAFKLLLIASALTVGLWFVPYAEILTYPFRIFVTYVHETGHALGALLTLGSVKGMVIHPNGSGETYTLGGVRFIISSAGYLGSTIFGALLLLLCHRGAMAKKILAGIAVSVLGVTLIFIGFGYIPLILSIVLAAIGLLWFGKQNLAHNTKAALGVAAGVTFFALLAFLGVTGSIFSWIFGLALGAALFLCAKYLQPRLAHFLLSFLAVQCCLNALFDLKTLVLLSAYSPTHTDALNMQSSTGIPAIVWAIVWSVISVIVLVVALLSYRRALASGKIAYSR